jgi:P-type Mg2+ transporter
MADNNASMDGLSSVEAAERLRHHGANLIAASHRRSLVMEFLSRFRNPLVLLLLAASVISFVTGDATSFYVIVAIIFLSVTLDFAKEYRAERAIEKLRESVSCTATLLRDGVAVELPLRDVVPGDVALLRAGDVIPADGVLLEARDLFVNQALLTGGPFPVEKQAQGTPEPEPTLADLDAAPQALFMNTSVVSGTARMRVLRTGSGTRLAGIARQLTAYAGPNPLEEGSRHFGMLILRMTLLLVLFVLLVNAYLQRAWLESFMFSVALAVGLTPELLPMIVTVSLARGALRMARIGVIIKRQAAIHNLGSIDVLCTDKTGTLTEAKIVLERHVDGAGQTSDHVLALAQANSHFESGIKSPLDDAILNHSTFDASGWRKVDEMPFDFERRRVAVLLDKLDGVARRVLIVKGAPEEIIDHCTEYEMGGEREIKALDTTVRESLLARFAALQADGLRVIAVAWRETPRTQAHALINDEDGLIFAGFAAFFDPPRAEAGEAVAALAAAGIAVKIITGDHEGVARHVCRETGINVTGCLTARKSPRWTTTHSPRSWRPSTWCAAGRRNRRAA